jgi:hypothetical protein
MLELKRNYTTYAITMQCQEVESWRRLGWLQPAEAKDSNIDEWIGLKVLGV